MAQKKPVRQRGPKDANKKFKKKTSVLVTEKVEYIDYKDVNLLQRFVSDRSKIRSRRVSGNDVQQQRDIATAVKNAREMALLPYTKRVATQRTARPPRDDDRGRREADVATETVEELELLEGADTGAGDVDTNDLGEE